MQASLTVTGMAGPDYSLFVSTNLTDWRLLYVTNPASLPMSLVDANAIQFNRFYRVSLGP